MSTQQNLFINSIFDTTVTADLKSNSESLLEEIDKIYEDYTKSTSIILDIHSI